MQSWVFGEDLFFDYLWQTVFDPIFAFEVVAYDLFSVFVTNTGDLHWKVVSVYINRTNQVVSLSQGHVWI